MCWPPNHICMYACGQVKESIVSVPIIISNSNIYNRLSSIMILWFLCHSSSVGRAPFHSNVGTSGYILANDTWSIYTSIISRWSQVRALPVVHFFYINNDTIVRQPRWRVPLSSLCHPTGKRDSTHRVIAPLHGKALDAWRWWAPKPRSASTHATRCVGVATEWTTNS